MILAFPKRECIKGIPRATELPKQDASPIKALSSILYLNFLFATKNQIEKTIIPAPKKDISNANV